MKTMKTDQARRSLLKGIAAIPVVSVTGYQTTAFADGHAKLLSVDDPTAKALGYVEMSTVDGKNCENCNIYTGAPGEDAGPCAIFPGKAVKAAGYCNSWIPKT